MKDKVDDVVAAEVLAPTTVAGMSAGTYIAIEVAKEGAEIGLITPGIIGATVGKFNNF